MGEQDSIIVAIELGSSKVCGIAGKMKDGSMQILAYAEDKTSDCIKRGVVYNIEKTTQSIKNVVNKLEATLKRKITRTYIGIGGQSVRSVKSFIKKNMLTPTYITQAHIDSITDESHEVSDEDCELIGYYVQGFSVDGSLVADPVGIMGTNVEGEFLNVVANKRLRNNIKTSFENLGLEIADYHLSAFELANNVLTDTEKRTGTALIDLGAGTTTIVVLKSNIIRQIITLPLGINNIKQDLCDLQIEYSEAEQLLLTYGDAMSENVQYDDEDQISLYTTSDGRSVEITTIQEIIRARLQEILVNVDKQMHNTEYADRLLGGVVITGGGANIKNIEKACQSMLSADKVRIAKKVIPQLIKNSDITSLSLESPTSCTIISLLLSGNENCTEDGYNGLEIFGKNEKTKDNSQKEEQSKQQKEEEEALAYIEGTKTKLRDAIIKLQKSVSSITVDDANKGLKNAAREYITIAESIITEDYNKSKDILVGKDKYNQSLREADDLITKCNEEADKLKELLRESEKRNSTWGKIGRWFDDLLKE
jgi:cell division protein FtsA